MRASLPDAASTGRFEQVAGLAELGVMTAALVHEMRASLFAAKGLVEVAAVRGGGLSAEQLPLLHAHLRDLDDLLDSYAGFGRLEDDVVRLDIREPIERALALADPRRRLVAATVECTGVSGWVVARPGAMRQVLVNVLHNALDAVEATADRRVWITTRSRDGRVRIEVRDSGVGIPDEVRARLFEPFVSTKAPNRGTGLGLYLSRRLALEAGGTLELGDADGGGTRVILELPAAEEPVPAS